MSESLSQQLAAIGLPAKEPVDLRTGVADHLDELLTGAFPWSLDAEKWQPEMVGAAREAHESLVGWKAKLELRLATHGIRLTDKFDPPKVPGGASYALGGKLYQHLEPCSHRLITVSESVAVVVCRQCGLPVNAIWWIAQHNEEISKATSWTRHLKDERSRLSAEVDALKKEVSRFKQAAKRAREAAVKASTEAAAPGLRKAPKAKAKRRSVVDQVIDDEIARRSRKP